MKICIILLMLLSTKAMAQQATLVNQANLFLSTLSEPLRAKAKYETNDAERLNWHFVPRERNGVSFREFNGQQRDAALGLLRLSLSEQGYEKTMEIIALENVLREVENRGMDDKYRDPLNYYFTIFGTPAINKPWGWRFEGHHIAFNFFSWNNAIESSTPSFFGSNPGVVLSGEQRGKEVLKEETALGFTLVNSFNQTQLKSALISNVALAEIVSFNSRKAVPLEPKGLPYGAMSDTQKGMLVRLLEVYVKNYELGFSNKLMNKIKKAGIENLSFAWAGSLKPGAGHYYRIQGPMLLIELDNTQNNANHVHSVVRDLTNDFGEDILREHYRNEH
jgi:Protein of unknown function (DUF3500)